MEHLFDTCTIKHSLINVQEVNTVISFCAAAGNCFCISNIIRNELRPPENIDEYEIAQSLYLNIGWLIDKEKKIKCIDINASPAVLQNYNDIRKRYYGWMSNPIYCRKLIEDGLLTEKQYKSKSFKHKDNGECSLIAIALTAKGSYVIVSNDKGEVCAHPDINLFNIYRDKDLIIYNFQEWCECNKFLSPLT